MENAIGLFSYWNGAERSNLLRNCLQLLNDTGAKVHSLTFDGAYSNSTMCKNLGASFNIMSNDDENHFCIQNPFTNDPIYIFYDACHMLKLIRNTLGDYKCILMTRVDQLNGNTTQLYQMEQNEGLKVATKLTKRHIYYFNEKMNVKLAAQVLSNSVSSALKFCQSLGNKYFNDIDGTYKIC